MVWALQSVTTKQSGSSTVAVNYPAGNNPGDVNFAFAFRGFGPGVTFTDSSGNFTSLISRNTNNASAIFWRVIDGSEPATENFTNSAGGGSDYFMARFTGGPPASGFIASVIASGNNGSSSGAGLNWGNLVLGTNAGCLILVVGIKSANLTSFNIPAFATGELAHSITSDPGEAWVVDYAIQTTPADIASGNWTIAGDSSASHQWMMVAILPLQSGQLPGEQSYPDVLPRVLARDVHQFYQVPLALATLPPPQMPNLCEDLSVPPGRQFPNSLRGMDQNLLLTTLSGQDRVLTPAQWDYEWDKPALPVALRSDIYGLNANLLTALTTFPPYTEYSWPVPSSPRPINRGFLHESQFQLNSGAVPFETYSKNLWDPVRQAKPRVENLGQVSPGLSLFFFIPSKPPLNFGQDPVPRSKSRSPQDWIFGMPLPIFTQLSTLPVGETSMDLPVRRRSSPAYLGLTYSFQNLFPGLHPVPLNTFVSELPQRRQQFRDIYSISFRYQFLTPSGPTPPPPGPGVVSGPGGRTILMPKKQGETVTRPFDFISRLGPTEVILNAQTIASVYSGVDPNPSAIINGPASVTGTIVYQSLTGGTVGVIYELICKIQTSLGQVLEMSAFWVVETDLP